MAEKMLWKEKERSRIRAVQLDNLRGMLGIRKVYVEEALVLNVMKDGAKWFPNEIF